MRSRGRASQDALARWMFIDLLKQEFREHARTIAQESAEKNATFVVEALGARDLGTFFGALSDIGYTPKDALLLVLAAVLQSEMSPADKDLPIEGAWSDTLP